MARAGRKSIKTRRSPWLDSNSAAHSDSTTWKAGKCSRARESGLRTSSNIVLQLINEARTNPAAAAQQISNDMTPQVTNTLNYYGTNLPAALQTISSATPQPPVAWNANLANAAQGQSQYMADNQIQSHTGCRRLFSLRTE